MSVSSTITPITSSSQANEVAWQKFKTKHYPNTQERDIAEIKQQAFQMTEYLFSGKGHSPDNYLAEKADINFKKVSDYSQEEKYALVFAISLKVAQQFRQFRDEGKLRITKEPGTSHSFIKLFGDDAVFYVLPSHKDPTKKYGIILIKRIENGAHNRAFLAYDLIRGEHVYRYMQHDQLNNKTKRQHWKSEYRTYSRLHQLGIVNILKVHDVFIIKKKTQLRALLLEKCDGNLASLCKTLTMQEQQSIIKQLLTTMSQLHANGFAHGDLSHGNLLYIKTPDGFTLKLCDFETSERASKGRGGTNTPEFMTPLGWMRKDTDFETIKKLECFAIGMIAAKLQLGDAAELPVVAKYRKKLLNIEYIEKQLDMFKNNSIDQDVLRKSLSNIYKSTPNLDDILKDDVLDQLKRSSPIYDQVYDLCFNTIIEHEYADKWKSEMQQIVKLLPKEPYFGLIAELLNLDDATRITAQAALDKLTAIT